MSTGAEIITSLDELIDEIRGLLESTTVEAVVELVELLGGGDALAGAVDEFSDVLTSLELQLGALIDTVEKPLRHAQSLAGLLGLLGPVVVGLERLVNTSSEQLADAGLDGVVQITAPISDAVGFAGDLVELGQGVLDLLPSPEKLHELELSFGQLIDTVEGYADAIE
ncbi:hypothetical protein [Haliangium sp.]|uniref:hypothetical protein n=1 Tax=Haliangium sp. TaxID=2663208 RepID=UPI003D116DF2